MREIEMLREARALISEPDRWIQHSFARDKYGFSALVSDPDAHCFCAAGALIRVRGEVVRHYSGLELMHVKNLLFSLTGQVIEIYNDTHTHAEVLALFDRAIRELELGSCL